MGTMTVAKVFAMAVLTGLLRYSAAAAAEQAPSKDAILAEEILRSAGGKAGLCVHLGVIDGKTTGDLARSGGALVHGLSADRVAVARAREFLQAEGLYGRVSVECGVLGRLPYADNLANLVVAEDLPRMLDQGLSLTDVLRVLRPGGVACLGVAPEQRKGVEGRLAAAGISDYRFDEKSRLWLVFKKPRPLGMDEWTHYRHGPEGSRVSQDALEPLTSLHWLAGPTYTAIAGSNVLGGNEYEAMVSGGGRFYSILHRQQLFLPNAPQATRFIVARDAFNGLLLWIRPFTTRMAGYYTCNWFVAGEDCLFTLEGDKVVALDGRTGEPIKEFGPAVGSPYSLLLHDSGRLVIAGPRRISCFSSATAKEQWQYPLAEENRGTCIGEGCLFVLTAKRLLAIDLKTGHDKWATDVEAWARGPRPEFQFYKRGLLVFTTLNDGRFHVHALSAKDGTQLWSSEFAPGPGEDKLMASINMNVLYAGDLIWIQRSTHWEGCDPATGKVKKKLEPLRNPGHGCHRDVATEQFFVCSRPSDFMAWQDGRLHDFNAMRGGCRAGIVLANGKYYSTPSPCMCMDGAIRGFAAFGSAGVPATGPAGRDAQNRLERVAAAPRLAENPHLDTEWPTFRHDSQRSGSMSGEIVEDLRLVWETPVYEAKGLQTPLADDWELNPLCGDRLTAPVAVGGRTFVCAAEGHQVVCLNAQTGRAIWRFTTGGRLDTPPTVYNGLCLVGCHDGWVYVLGADTGDLIWRFRAAPAERKMLAFGQLESTWPVIGGVLVENGLAYCLAGRSTEVDGGLYAYALDPADGRLVWSKQLQDGKRVGFTGAGDLLVGDREVVSIGGSTQCRLDPKTGDRLPPKAVNALRAATRNWGFAPGNDTIGNLMDRSWHKTSNGGLFGRFHTQYYDSMVGQIVVFDQSRTVSFVRSNSGIWYSNYTTGSNTLPRVGTLMAKERGKGFKDALLWSVPTGEPFQVEAMAICGDRVFAAGPADESRAKGKLWVVSAKNGKKLSEIDLASPPVSDGIAAAGGRLYLATRDGKLLCFGGKQ